MVEYALHPQSILPISNRTPHPHLMWVLHVNQVVETTKCPARVHMSTSTWITHQPVGGGDIATMRELLLIHGPRDTGVRATKLNGSNNGQERSADLHSRQTSMQPQAVQTPKHRGAPESLPEQQAAKTKVNWRREVWAKRHERSPTRRHTPTNINLQTCTINSFTCTYAGILLFHSHTYAQSLWTPFSHLPCALYITVHNACTYHMHSIYHWRSYTVCLLSAKGLCFECKPYIYIYIVYIFITLAFPWRFWWLAIFSE